MDELRNLKLVDVLAFVVSCIIVCMALPQLFVFAILRGCRAAQRIGAFLGAPNAVVTLLAQSPSFVVIIGVMALIMCAARLLVGLGLLSTRLCGTRGLTWALGRGMLDQYWLRHFGHDVPIAHRLRERFHSRWVRFHSLPNSKRYAEDTVHQEIVLHRFNSIVADLADNGASLELLTTNWSPSAERFDCDSEFSKLQIPASRWRTIAPHEIEDDPEPNYWHVFQSSVSWPSSELDNVIRLIADDKLSNVILLSTSTSWLVHPYDGGVDVILGTSDARDKLAAKYQEWQSSRPDGL